MSGKPKTPQASAVTIEAKAFHDLQQAEAKHRSIFENAAEGIFQSTPEGRYLSVNPAMARLYGYDTPEEMMEAVTDIARQVYADPEMRREFARRLKKEGKVEKFEARNLRKDGSLIWTSTNARIVRDAKGKVLFYEGFVQDITERRRAEEALHFTRFSIDCAADTMVCVARDARFVDVNDAFCRSMGYSREELLSMTVHDIDPDYSAEIWPEFWKKLKQNGSLTFESYHHSKEGRIFPVEIIANYFEYNGKEYHSSFARDITERKRAEEALRESEQRLNFHMENSPTAIVEWDANFIVTRWSGEAERMFGWSWAETIGKAIMDLHIIYDEDIPIVQNVMEQLTDGVSRHVVSANRNYTKGGQVIYCEWYNSVLLNAQGKMVSVMSQVLDITERKRAEETLERSEAKYRSLVETASAGVATIDLAGNLVFVNQALCNMAGCTEEELLGKPFASFLHPDDMESVAQLFLNTFQDPGSRVELEFRAIQKDGHTIYCHSSPTILWQQGEITGFNAIIQDITDRKRAEEQITYQAKLLATVNDAVVASDAQYRITAWNAAAESMYGWKAEEVLGRFGLDITRTEFPGVDKAEMLRAIAERGSWRGEATQARKDGMPFPVEVSSMVLHDESGQITGYVSVNRDITGRKRAEETLRRSEERYRALFENMMDGFAYCRMYFDDKNRPVDFVYLTVNTAFERLTGLRNAVGHRVTDVIPGIKEAHPELFEIYGRVAMAGQPERFEVYFKPLAKWLSIAVYSPEEGYFVAVFDDITERKRAEEALRQREREFSTLAENATDMIVRFDTDLRHVYCNAAVELQLGVPASTFIGKTPLETGGPREQAEFIDKSLRQVLETGQEQEVEQSYPTPSGSKHFLTRIVPERDEQGKIESLLAITRDITERKRAEEALRESEGRFRLLYEKAPLGYQSLDAAGCFIDVNQAWLDTLGYSREEVIGRWFGDFFAPHEVEAFKQRFPKFKATGETQVEVEMVRKDGAHATIAIVGRIAYDEHGGFKQTHCILTDITERKKAEESLRESRARQARAALAQPGGGPGRRAPPYCT